MNFILDKIVDIALEPVVELAKEKYNEMLEENRLKRVLKKSIKDCIETQKIENSKDDVDCILDEESIEALKVDLIKPNLSVEELDINLNSVFEKCITTDDKDKAYIMRKYICQQYKLGVAGLISIAQVDQDVHKIGETLNKSTNQIRSQITQSENKIIKAVQNMPTGTIHFLDELDSSRVYCYISMTLKGMYDEEEDEELFWEIADNIGAEQDLYIDKEGFFNVSFNFFEPIPQYELRGCLAYIDELFSKNNIGILSIRSHF